MNTPIVIDACSLINLLRIDEDDNFLYKHLKSLDVHISETVYNEIKSNIFKNAISETDMKRIKTLLPLFPTVFKLHQDEDIKKDVGIQYFEQIISYTGHSKKYNGELSSSVLALVLSRYEESIVCFLTDDFPAKNEFSQFFSLQQIGLIKDSIDLLLMLHWSKSNFSRKKLESILSDLRAEYNRTQNTFVKEIVALKTNFKKSDAIRKIIEDIEDSFYFSKDVEKYEKSLRSIEGVNNKDVKKCLSVFSNLSKQPKLAQKATLVLQEMKKMDIYKLA